MSNTRVGYRPVRGRYVNRPLFWDDEFGPLSNWETDFLPLLVLTRLGAVQIKKQYW